MELVSQHNHTNMTGHGYAPIDELVAHAHELGMTNLAITEHYPLSKAIDPTNFVSLSEERLPEYLSALHAVREQYSDMEIVIGCELDWLGDDEDRVFKPYEFDEFEHILGSVHFLDLWPFDDPEQAGHWDEAGPDEIWRRYFEVWIEAATSDMPFTAMAHPDLVKKFGYWPSFNPLPLYKEAAEALASTDRMIEINTSGATYACKEMFPAPALLTEFRRAGVPCTIGSDAHKVEHVDRGILEGYKYAYEAGYRELTLVVPGGDRRMLVL